MARHHRHQKHHRHHRNPLGIGQGEIAMVAWGVAGYGAAEILPAKFAPSFSTGVPGYLAKIVTAFVARYAGRFVSANASSGLFVGALISAGVAIVKDYLPSLGLSAYYPSPYALPTMSNPWGAVVKNPYAALNPPPPALTAAGTMGRSAYAGRRARY